MFELAPQGFTPLLSAYLRLAKAYSPEAFIGDEIDGETLGACVLEALYGDHETSAKLLSDSAIWAFGKIHFNVRQYLADFRFPVFALDANARLLAIDSANYWATDEGNRDLLMGWYGQGLILQPLPIFIEDRAIDSLLPVTTRSTTNARGRDLLTARLRQHMAEHPVPNRSKSELLSLLADDLSLSKHVKQAAWDDAVRYHPAYTRPGPRRSISSCH